MNLSFRPDLSLGLFRSQLLRALGLPTAALAQTCTAAGCGDSGTTTVGETTPSSSSGESTDSDTTSGETTTTDTTESTQGPGSNSDATSSSTDPSTSDPSTSSTSDPSTGSTSDPSTSGTDPSSTSDPTDTSDGSESDTNGVMCDAMAPEGFEEATACFPIPQGLASCDECDEQCVLQHLNGAITGDPDFCWASELMVLCGPDEGIPQEEGACCYKGAHAGILCEGRPCMVDGVPRLAELEPRADWSDTAVSPALAELDHATRVALAAEWRRDGLMEHGSIAAFSRFIMQLMAVAAPAWLVDDAQQAIADEIEHARLCFGLADAYAPDGVRVGPGPLDVDDLLNEDCDMISVAVGTVLEGCVGETIAALLVRRAAQEVTDPEVRRVLEQIAADEARHATLAWRFVQWAIEQGGEPVRAAVEAAFDEALSAPPEPEVASERAGADAAALLAHGRLDPQRQREVIHGALVDVIGPCARALLAEKSQAQALEILPFAPGAVH